MRMPWSAAPETGQATEVAPGILWLRLPLPMALDHVNVYVLDDGDGWTLVDTGVYSKAAVALWNEILDGPLAGKPVTRVLLTHHHPDHVGMAGWFQERGAEIITSRTAYLMARMLILDVQTEATEPAKNFWRSAGMNAEIYATRVAERPFNFADIVHPLGIGYRRLQQGDVFEAAGRKWDVHMGNGHAPEHITLWSHEGDVVLAGDQILSSISPNVGVHPTEPGADPVGEWLESCERLETLATEDRLVLGGHKLPFTGLPIRMRQLIENHHGALKRLVKHLETPQTACDCFAPLFKRKIDAGTYGLAMVEAFAHLNHLHQLGQVERSLRDDGAYLWRAVTG